MLAADKVKNAQLEKRTSDIEAQRRQTLSVSVVPAAVAYEDGGHGFMTLSR
jgi:hypothetical protein